MKKVLIIVSIITLAFTQLKAQIDPHLSQYYVYPSWLNPALTGAFDGDFRVSGVYRNQWNNVAEGFNAAGISADVKTDKNLNFGASILQQNAGSGYSYLMANTSASYSGLRFDAEGNKRLVFGLQVGVVNRRFDASKFQFGDQWGPISGYDPGVTSTETFQNLSSTVLDLGAGAIYYDADPSKRANIFAGFSLSHLNQPVSNFTAQSTNERLLMRYTLHGGVNLKISEGVSIVPNALYLRQGNAEEAMVGGYVQMDGLAGADVLFGANYRFKDAIVPYLGLTVKRLVFGFSYDLNNSQLGKSVANANSSEFSVSYVFRKAKKLGEKQFICPRF